MASLQSINIAFTPHSTVTLLPNAVPDPDVAPSPSITTNLFPDAAPQLPAPISSHSTTAALLPDADAIPDAEPELPDATVTHPTAIAPLHNVTRFLLAKLTVNLQKMSSHHIVEEHRIKNLEHVVEILRKEANIEFIEKVSTIAAKYIHFLHAPMIALDKWRSVGTEWRKLKEEIDKIISDSRSPNKARPLWKLPTTMHASIFSYLANEDVLRVSFVARGSLSKMAHEDETLWRQRAIYQLGEDQVTLWHMSYSNIIKPWKKICLTLTYKGICFPDISSRDLGTFKNGKLNGSGRRFILFREEEGIFKDGILNGPGKIIHRAIPSDQDKVEEGEFVNGKLAKGKKTYPHGYKEKGTFKDGKLYQGKKIFSYGLEIIQEGIFEKDELNGQGKRIWSSGRIDDGLFEKGRFIKGKRTYPHGYKEEGTFENNELNGIGTKIYDQRIEVGIFVQGEFTKGKRTYHDGNTEVGSFFLGELIQGTKTFVSGVVLEEEGSFRNKLLEGTGRRVLKRKVEAGEFVRGKLVQAASTSSTSSSLSSFFKGCFSR